MGEQLDQTSVKQDTSRSRIEDTWNDVGFCTVTIVGGSNTETDGDANRGTEGVENGSGVSCPPKIIGKSENWETGAKAETFEHLVKDDDNEKGNKGSVDSEGKADYNTGRAS